MFKSKIVVRCLNIVRERDFGFVQREVPPIIKCDGTTENHIVFNVGCPHNAFLIDISRKAVLNGLRAECVCD
jgi:hypothetical protein